ncbi:MAG: RNA polymerase sigma factor [Anaerolineales bacterium]
MNSKQEQDSFSLEALRNGDRAEFARVVEAYSPMIYRLGLKMLNNPQDAEDVLQETFIKAYKNIAKFDGRSSVSTWLYRIATNEALMSLRRKRPDSISFENPMEHESEPQEPLQIVDWCCLPEEEYLTAEGRARLDEAAASLPANLRIVFVLRDIEGLSTRETAQVLDISEMAVKTRLSRARLRLREDLSEYFGQLVEEV